MRYLVSHKTACQQQTALGKLIYNLMMQAYFGLMLIDADRNSAAAKSSTTLKEPKPNLERRPSAQFKPVCSHLVVVFTF